MHSRPSYRRFLARVPLLLAPASTLLLVGGVHASPNKNRPDKGRPALANPSPFGTPVNDQELGEMPMGGPVFKANAAQAPSGDPEWPGGSTPPPGVPEVPGTTYANASDTKSAVPGQPPPALGETPVSLDAIRALQIGPVRIIESPMRVGNLDILAPVREELPLLGVTVTKADLNNVPLDPNAAIENTYFQINRPGQSPIVLSMGQSKAWIDKNEQTLRAAPLMVGGQIYLPVFSLAPLLGAATRLDGAGTLILNPTVESVQVFPVRDTVAITIKTSKPLPNGLAFKTMTDAKGNKRMYVDFPGYSMGFDALATTNERVVATGLGDIIRARAGMPSKFPDTTRITFDLKKSVTGSVLQTDPTIFTFVLGSPIPPLPNGGRTISDPLPPIIASKPLSNLTIVLDAGHGGHDTGAQGGHTNEKDRTLDLIQKLATNLRMRGANVLLTRSNDTFVSLQGRVDYANRLKADLFVSIHNNASNNRGANGTETFYYTAQSVGLAREIHKELSKATGLANRGIGQERFFVIRKTWMPSVLLEVAFVTNPREENLLNSPDWCQRTVDGVTRGIINYNNIYRKGGVAG